MSGIVNCRAALETALNNMSPAVITAWENLAFTPPASTVPYQRAFVLFATPDNPEWGSSHQELGIFQVNLCYPLQIGTGTVGARAELLRTTFKRGSSFTSSGVTVTITHTPGVSAGVPDGDRFVVPVSCRFMAQIT